MIDPVLLLAAFLTGIAGAGHCAGMCGGIAGALAHAIPPGQQTAALTLAFSAGRIAMYALLGACVGGIAMLLAPADMAVAMLVTRLLTGLVMVAIGLYLLRWVNWLQLLESAGSRVWRQIAPLARRMIPVTSVARATGIGALWGLLPCGLVYGALLYATTSGTAVAGATTMACFGLGTLPAVLGMGMAASWLTANAARLRQVSGSLMLLYGGWTLLSTLLAVPAILDGTCRSPGDVFRYAISLLMHVNEA
jgi:sulfite exporter TauE/SafE